MGTNCAPLRADIFLYSYEADFIQSLFSTGKKQLASQFNLTYRYIDDVLSIIRKLSGPNVSWTWDQRHYRDHHFCFLPIFTTVDWERWSTSHFHLRKKIWFQFRHYKLFRSWVVILHLHRPMAFWSLNLYDTPGLAPRMHILSWGPGDFPVSYSNRNTSWDAWNRIQEVLWSIRGSYSSIWSLALTNVKWNSYHWPTVTSPTDQTFHQFQDFGTELDIHRIMSGFHGAFATGVAC